LFAAVSTTAHVVRLHHPCRSRHRSFPSITGRRFSSPLLTPLSIFLIGFCSFLVLDWIFNFDENVEKIEQLNGICLFS
jgi:hypothetical protein